MLHGERDMGKVIDYIRQAPDGFFLYLTHAYSRNDTQHSYYNLRFVFIFVIYLLIIKYKISSSEWSAMNNVDVNILLFLIRVLVTIVQEKKLNSLH
jgi:hypothetical protein